MENKNRNIFIVVVFFIFIFALVLGGYIYVRKLSTTDIKEKTDNVIPDKDYRIDKTKEYIYFENEEIISEEPDISLKDIVINIKGAEVLNASLKAEIEEYKKQVVLLNESNKDSEKELLFENSNIFSAKEREYKTFKSHKYFSVVINDLEYNCYTNFSIFDTKSYVIDMEDSRMLSEEEILTKYNLTLDDVKERVGAKLDELKLDNEIKDTINKDLTLEKLFETYGIYIDGSSIYVSYIVKTNYVDYNDIVKLN